MCHVQHKTVKCWGAANKGQLGYGDTSTRGDSASEMGDYLPEINFGNNQDVIFLAVGYLFNCVLLNGPNIKCWGYNSNGQLGYEDQIDRGDDPAEMGEYLEFVDLGVGFKPNSVSAAIAYTCSISRVESNLKCWGVNILGQLGYGDIIDRGGASGDMGEYLDLVKVGTGVDMDQVECRSESCCILTRTLTIKCWGSGTTGRLGYGDTSGRGDQVNEMGDYLQEVDLPSGVTPSKLVLGYDHAVSDFFFFSIFDISKVSITFSTSSFLSFFSV